MIYLIYFTLLLFKYPVFVTRHSKSKNDFIFVSLITYLMDKRRSSYGSTAQKTTVLCFFLTYIVQE